MDIPLFKKLLRQQLISKEEFENVEQHETAPVSVFWDVTTLLYIGILLFTGGLSVLVYKNIDSIGHAFIISAIGVMCAIAFVYCFRNAEGYSNKKVQSPTLLFDYVLLLGCLLLLTFIGYLQFQYNVFGKDWGLATFIPMVLLFYAAYYFDNIGILSMAITNLAAWAGFTVAPLTVLKDNDFTNERLIYTGLILGTGLAAISFVSIARQVKTHFAFTYKNFGLHILFISLVAAMIHFDKAYLLWFLVLIAAVIFFVKNALKEKSFYILVIAFLYTYIGLSYVVVMLLDRIREGDAILFIGFTYFIATGIGFIKTLMYYNKMLKKNDSL